MPDATIKVVIFFEATGKKTPTGWTEVWYRNVGLPSSTADLIQQIYVPARRSLLGFGARVKYLRVSNVPPNRITEVRYIFGKAGDPDIFTNTPADDYDPTQVDLLCRVQSTIGKRRQLWVGGLPDSVTDTGQDQGIRGAFTSSKAWKTWVAAIKQCGLGIRFKTANGPPKVYSFDPVAEVIPVEARKRDRGRPFNLFRGKRLV